MLTLRCSISTTLFYKCVNTFCKTYSSTITNIIKCIRLVMQIFARKCNKMTFNMRDASHAEQFMAKFFSCILNFHQLSHSYHDLFDFVILLLLIPYTALLRSFYLEAIS